MNGSAAPVASYAEIRDRVIRRGAADGRHLVVIGGRARSGKSTLASRLSASMTAAGIPSRVICADNWIVDLSKRPSNATVFERFEVDAFATAVETVLADGVVHPPIYDAAERRRVANASSEGIRIESGIVIAEGVVALLSSRLRSRAEVRIYVEIGEKTRLERLYDFCVNTKGMSPETAHRTIEERLAEEDARVSGFAGADLRYCETT